MRVRSLLSGVGLIVIAGANVADAAQITWRPTVDILSTADLITEGTFFHARNMTSDGRAPMVILPNGEPILFEPLLTPPPSNTTPTAGFFTGPGGTSGDPELDIVLDSQSFGGTGWGFEIDGLIPGNEYIVQIIAGGDMRGGLALVTQRVGDAEPTENISGDIRRGGVGTAIGTFFAASGIQRIRTHPGLAMPQLPALSGYILRELSEPLPPDGITMSSQRIDVGTVAGTLIATLEAIDPNVNDTHTFGLFDTENNPDNTLFSIVGDQLFAAADLGPVGTTYQIELRTTDSTGFREIEGFTLQVLPPPAITGLHFESGTLQFTAPAIPGRRLALSYSPDLEAFSWIDLGNFVEIDGILSFTDPDPFRLARPKGYYRAFLRPLTP
jgi:hypothetical protein